MKRYTIDSAIIFDADGAKADAAMVEADDGEWVRHDEAAAEIERFRVALGSMPGCRIAFFREEDVIAWKKWRDSVFDSQGNIKPTD
jgi:hypothetical protein